MEAGGGGSASTRLRATLRDELIRGDLAPGAKLSEQEVARAHGASRQPVREAFIALAAEGLLVVRPQRGTYVAPVSLAALRDARFVRAAVEAGIVRRLAADPPVGALADLRRLVADQWMAAGRDAFRPLDEAFHRALAAAAGVPGAWDAAAGAKARTDRALNLSGTGGPASAAVAQHGAVVEAIAAGEGDRAEAAMRDHLEAILPDPDALAAARPDLFVP